MKTMTPIELATTAPASFRQQDETWMTAVESIDPCGGGCRR